MEKNKRIVLAVIIGLVIMGVFIIPKFRNDDSIQTEFLISDINIELKTGDCSKINYTISDENAQIMWFSSDEKVATVNDAGLVCAIKYGTSTITGKVLIDNIEISSNVIVNAYSGDKNIVLEKIDIPDGEILMGVNNQYDLPITLVPSNAYINSINYEISDQNIIELDNGKIIAKNIGTSDIRITVNNARSESIKVNVINDNIETRIIKMVQSLKFNINEINIKVNEKSKISYTIVPTEGDVYSEKWESSDSSIASVIDGEIVGKKNGTAIINLTVNDSISDSVIVNVSTAVNEIKVDWYPKLLLKIGESTKITAHLEPITSSDSITYKSSNSAIAIVNNGIITATGVGSARITLSASNKNKSLNINVIPKAGVINGTGNLWGYQSLNEKTPVKADLSFFVNLVAKGKGTLSKNIYTYNGYSYDINNSILTTNKTSVMTRIYYPQNSDLSSLNIFTYMGGDGENNMGGLFNTIEKDRSIIRSAGVVVLVSAGSKYNTSYTSYSGYYATSFAKAIFDQKSTGKVTIAGFSTGGTKVMGAANLGNYDRIIVFSSYYNWPTSAKKIKNKEIIFYVPGNDFLYTQAKSTLYEMKNNGYTNVTIVSNNDEMSSLFKSKFLVINPGKLMNYNHVNANVTQSKLFSYANDW